MAYRAICRNGLWHVSNPDHGHVTATDLTEEKARALASFLNAAAGETDPLPDREISVELPEWWDESA